MNLAEYERIKGSCHEDLNFIALCTGNGLVQKQQEKNLKQIPQHSQRVEQ
ncbi:MAG: hypothetical protein H6606_00300 [Flavobacteriales bacterium]|nr:hypothetical protein [Flavobacteriales bacterium]